MRKAILLVWLLIALSCVGQEVIYNATPTFGWDATTQYVDGTAFDPADIVEYEVFRADPDVHTNQVSNGIVSALSMTLTVPNGGPWAYGVRTVLTTDGGATTLYSDIAWSDVEGTPNPFCYKTPQTTLPNRPTGLRTE